jgi:hypothetical protein
MDRRIACLLLLLASVVGAGCSTTKALHTPSAPTEGQALVYFIRKAYPPTLFEGTLAVNGKPMATIANNDFVAINVPVGSNTISIDVFQGKPFSFTMPVARAEKSYVVLTGNVTSAGQAVGYLQTTFYFNWHLRAYPVSEAEAQAIVGAFGKRLE